MKIVFMTLADLLDQATALLIGPSDISVGKDALALSLEPVPDSAAQSRTSSWSGYGHFPYIQIRPGFQAIRPVSILKMQQRFGATPLFCDFGS
jgi:hypothetical protein